VTRTYSLTTAIHYPNGRPHVGHAYEAIATDCVARHQRWMGRDVLFLTGTDEHGMKMLRTARDAGVTPRALADANSAEFRALFDALGVSYDRFQRTTAPDHHAASQELWRRMEANGDIYRSRYAGWYSVRDEAFYDEAELVAGEDGAKLSPQGTPVEWTEEDSFFFRLSAYQDRLLQLYRDRPDFLQPQSRLNEVRAFVEGGLKDLSISRASIDWGVPVPGHPGHVMYVWVDALTTYLSGMGWPEDPAAPWPASLHVIGKDITRFHAVYWPAFLWSAGLELPGRVFGHGFILLKGEKMSKSAGNVVDPVAMHGTYGVDALRWFLLRDVPFGQDGSLSHEALVARANADLANSFGNLAQRTLTLVHRNCEGAVPPAGDAAEDRALLEHVRAACADELPAAFEALQLHAGLEAWMRAVFACNAYVDAQAPWALAKSDRARMAAVLGTLVACVAALASAAQAAIPHGAGRLLDALGVAADARTHAVLMRADWFAHMVAPGFRVGAPTPIFPRLDPAREPQ
jgi:methionyl-tRNA synthetase